MFEFIVGVLILLGLIMVLFRGIRKERKTSHNLLIKNQQITEQKKQIDLQNQKLKEEKDDLVHIVAHDLKAPFNKITGLMSLVRLEMPETSPHLEQYFDLIEKVSVDAGQMIGEWLDIKNIENQSWEMDYQDLVLGKLIQEIITGYQDNLEQKDIHLTLNNPIPNQVIYSDENTLIRIFDNLISNAIKFSPKHSNVWIKLENQEENIKFAVKDEGPGLNENDKKNLFGKFQKLSARPTAGESSSGLGLSIVSKLIEQLDGTIYVESTYGEGATFIVEIPKNKNNGLSTTLENNTN